MEKSIQEMTDDELLIILRAAEDTGIPGSLYQCAFGEWQIRQQKALLEVQRNESSRLTRVNWALVGVTLVIGLLGMATTLYIFHLQNSDDFKKESATLMFQFANEFRNVENSPLVYAVATIQRPLLSPRPLLCENGGKFKDEQLDNYLVKYEILYNAYANRLISRDDLNTAFGFDIKMASENKEIMAFISYVRSEYNDPSLYIGFAKLAQLVMG